MIYTVYIDVLFLLNLIMDILVLIVLKKVLNRPTVGWKVFLGGLLGAVSGCIFLVADIKGVLWRMLTLICTGAGMVWITFEWGEPQRGRLKRMIQETGGLFGTAVVMGGVFEALAEAGGTDYLMRAVMGGRKEVLSLGGWIFLAAATFFLCRFLQDRLWGIMRQRKYLCRVVIAYGEKSVEIAALQDTGNRLVSPDGSQPVHILEYEICRQICDKIEGILYIPFQSVGKQNGLLPAIYLDSMVIIRDGERKEIKKPLVGVVRQPLSQDGSYHMLLNEKLQG